MHICVYGIFVYIKLVYFLSRDAVPTFERPNRFVNTEANLETASASFSKDSNNTHDSTTESGTDNSIVNEYITASKKFDPSKYDDSDVEIAENHGSSDDENDGDENSDDDYESSEDEEELTRRELEKIKAEKEAQKKREEEEEALYALKEHEGNIMMSNPLMRDQFETELNNSRRDTNTTLKRRWDDDTVFKNQAVKDSGNKKRLINDTVRSDFHKAFLNKYFR